MITVEQAKTASNFHRGYYEARLGRFSDTKCASGPNKIGWRRNGQTKTWKTRPQEFRVPVKHGLYDHDEITHENAADWYVPEECPICNKEDKS